jgi:hypothetical protein
MGGAGGLRHQVPRPAGDVAPRRRTMMNIVLCCLLSFGESPPSNYKPQRATSTHHVDHPRARADDYDPPPTNDSPPLMNDHDRTPITSLKLQCAMSAHHDHPRACADEGDPPHPRTGPPPTNDGPPSSCL